MIQKTFKKYGFCIGIGLFMSLGCSGGNTPSPGINLDINQDVREVQGHDSAGEIEVGDVRTDKEVLQDAGQDERDTGLDKKDGETGMDVFEQEQETVQPNDTFDRIDSLDGDSGACHGDPGCTCSDNSECDSGFCIETPDGMVCAGQCGANDTCPQGFHCIGEQQGDTVVRICVHDSPRLCMACTKDDDCKTTYSGTGARCVA